MEFLYLLARLSYNYCVENNKSPRGKTMADSVENQFYVTHA